MDTSPESPEDQARQSFITGRAIERLVTRGGGPTEPLEPKQAVCPQHGGFTSTGYRLTLTKTPREIWSRCPACERDITAAETREKEAQEATRREQIRRAAMEGAGIPLRFQSRTLDNFVADTPEKEKALQVAREFAASFPDMYRQGKSLIFSGGPGTGKSHLATSIGIKVMADYSVRYITAMDMIRAIRATWRRDSEETENDVLDQLGASVGLLIIDELGVQYGTDAEANLLFDVLDRRYRNMLPTILLTNQDVKELRGTVGDRVYDRLRETAQVVSFAWASYRPQAREAV